MNKYWIHSCTGQKAELYTLPCCDDDKGWVKLIKKEDSNDKYTFLKVNDNDFHNYWIPITKAEYDSSLTLEEIKMNRIFKYKIGDVYFCTKNHIPYMIAGHVYEIIGLGNLISIKDVNSYSKGACLSFEDFKTRVIKVDRNLKSKYYYNIKSKIKGLVYCTIAGDLYMINDSNQVYYLSFGDFKNYCMPVSSDIKEEMALYMNDKGTKELKAKCISHIPDCIDIIPDDTFIITNYNENFVYLKSIYRLEITDYKVTLDSFKQHFKIIDNSNFKSKDTFESLCQEMVDVHKAKNHDYGDSFHNLFKELGINYAYGHLKEKLERVKTLKDNEAKVKSESMIDSLKDLANYAIMTIIELQDK